MQCIDENILSSYLDEELPEAERRNIEGHIAVCRQCLDLLIVAYEAQGKRTSPLRNRRLARKISEKIIRTKRNSKDGKKGRGLKWLLSALFMFALSFIVKRYFLQFLAASAILGFKWAMEGEAARRAIMIFKGIEPNEKKTEERSPHPGRPHNCQP